MSRHERWSGLVGVGGAVVAALGWLLSPLHFYGGWLAAVTFYVGWPLGSIALLLIHSLTGGRWGDVLRPALRTGVCALPLLLPALLPLLAGLHQLYPWARPDAHFGNAFYLNLPFLAVRWLIYLVVWFGLAWLVLRGGDLAGLAPAGLFLLAITTTFAGIDATMSLDPHFTSSIYGMIAAAGMVLLALSVAVLLTVNDVAAEEREVLGKLILALVILWIYLDFMQLLIVWQSDLAKEAPWYIEHSGDGWGVLRAGIALGHFLLPFALLLSPRMQRSRRVLSAVAWLLIAMEALRSWWTVLPPLHEGIGWVEIACMIAVGSFAYCLAVNLSRRQWGSRAPAFAGSTNG